jgi:tRNA A37 threonylcarbamoyladenosine dehydratase
VVAVTATFGQCAAGWVLDEIARSSKNGAISPERLKTDATI